MHKKHFSFLFFYFREEFDAASQRIWEQNSSISHEVQGGLTVSAELCAVLVQCCITPRRLASPSPSQDSSWLGLIMLSHKVGASHLLSLPHTPPVL